MELEEMVCSLEQAKKLHKLGVKIDTYFCWIDRPHKNGWFSVKRISPIIKDLHSKRYQVFSAPTVAELGVILKDTEDFCVRSFWNQELDKWGAGINIVTEEDYFYEETLLFETEAETRCDALIWLIENGYLKVEEIKL